MHRFTLSFDLLFKGLEITTGGQRIHDYNILVQKIEDRGMTQEGMEQYLDTFKHGMPPHGGLGNRSGTSDHAAPRRRKCP